MYHDSGLAEIDVGKFRLREWPEMNSIWIERASGNAAGEGGQFSLEDFEKAIEAFYNANF